MRKKISLKQVFIFAFISVSLLFFTRPVYSSDSTIPQVKVYNSRVNLIRAEFLAYQEGFRGGVDVAAGDIDGDKRGEIVTGAGIGGGPQVRIFNALGEWTGKDFFAYDPNFKGGVKVATGDINKDGKDEIIAGAGPGGGPQVRVFNQKGEAVLQFFAFNSNFKGGVKVAAGDINRDGKEEIICGAGPEGGPHIRVFDMKGNLIWQTFAFHQDFRGGIDVAAGDVNGDGKDEIIVSQFSQGQAWVKIYKGNANKTILANFLAYASDFEGGCHVAAGDIDGDGLAEIITGAGSSGGPHLKIFDGDGRWTGWETLAYYPEFRGGVKVAAFDLDNDGEDEIITAPGFRAKQVTKCEGNCVALTFDDGYSQSGSFEMILDVLKRRDVKATFFILGKVMQTRPDLMKRIVNEEHQLANHSYTHGWFTKMPPEQIRWEITYSDEIAKSITGLSTKPYFRYPYRARNSFTDQVIKNLGYLPIPWTADSCDSRRGATLSSVISHSLVGLHNGSIILGHTQSLATALALDTIITTIEERGYQLVTVAELP